MLAHDRVFMAFFELKVNRLYFNQIKERTGLSNSSLQNSLKKLTDDGILSIDKTKSNTFYEIQDEKYFSLKFSEIALFKFKQLNSGVRIPLQGLLKKVEFEHFMIILFGSASVNKETRNSDVDLLVVLNNQYDFSKIKREIESVSNYPLNIFKCDFNKFRLSEDHIVIQAKKTGFPIKSEQSFYEVILDEYR